MNCPISNDIQIFHVNNFVIILGKKYLIIDLKKNNKII